ncbi:MAG: hypothetical protein LBC40_02870, partial [Dysgonamonadaceae bacterium]|nr:hypothetical protein [Dysgonamonadaceae bacterium]
PAVAVCGIIHTDNNGLKTSVKSASSSFSSIRIPFSPVDFHPKHTAAADFCFFKAASTISFLIRLIETQRPMLQNTAYPFRDQR